MDDKFSDKEPDNSTQGAKSDVMTQPSESAPALPDISHDLKAPFLPHIKAEIISYDQVHAGVCVHIPGSALMLCGDELVFYWGVNSSSTPILLNSIGANSVVRVLCITYNFIECVQYGLVDVYFEVYRDQYLIGTSPTLMVTVNRNNPVTPRQRQRKRSINRKFSRNPENDRF